MVAGVDQTGQMDETSVQENTCSQAVISRVLVKIGLIALVVSMTSLAPEQAVAILQVIGL